ncbi:hypothetical protein [Niallia sp. Krafla_26]|uniref:hypothetical protein n=1 Tax=Niallia sp. Krafla_26 TaxID=3064703 RepID=UPI003D16F357
MRLKTLNKINDDILFLFTIIDEWSQTGSLTTECRQAWVQNYSLLETSLRNWNEGIHFPELSFIETAINYKYHIPAIWHAQHLIETLKKNSRPVFFP